MPAYDTRVVPPPERPFWYDEIRDYPEWLREALMARRIKKATPDAKPAEPSWKQPGEELGEQRFQYALRVTWMSADEEYIDRLRKEARLGMLYRAHRAGVI